MPKQVNDSGTTKKAVVGTISVASVGLLGFITYTFLKRNTKRRFIDAAKGVIAVKSCFPTENAEKTLLTNTDCMDKAIDASLLVMKTFHEIEVQFKKAQLKNEELTMADFIKNAVLITKDEFEKIIMPAFELIDVLVTWKYVNEDGTRGKTQNKRE